MTILINIFVVAVLLRYFWVLVFGDGTPKKPPPKIPKQRVKIEVKKIQSIMAKTDHVHTNYMKMCAIPLGHWIEYCNDNDIPAEWTGATKRSRVTLARNVLKRSTQALYRGLDRPCKKLGGIPADTKKIEGILFANPSPLTQTIECLKLPLGKLLNYAADNTATREIRVIRIEQVCKLIRYDDSQL